MPIDIKEKLKLVSKGALSSKSPRLARAYRAVNDLFPKISNYCAKCKKCCVTYGFLLKEEAQIFIALGIPVVQINNKIYCFDFFKKDRKKIRIIEKIPRCFFYKDGRCIIYKNRPFDCRLFPLKIRFNSDKGTIGISTECEYISSLSSKKRKKLCNNIIKALNKVPKNIINEYFEMLYSVSQISKKKQFRIIKIVDIIRLKKEHWKYEFKF